MTEESIQSPDTRPIVAEQQGGAVSENSTQKPDRTDLATAYELAAQWHDKQAVMCKEIAKDEPRIDAAIRDRAAQAAIHHGASAAGLRLAASQIRRATRH